VANTDVRRFARGHGIPFWRVCEELGISEPTMTRRLRTEMPETEKARLREIITKLAGECDARV